MALKIGDKSKKPDGVNIPNYCVKQESKKKSKPVRKKYSSKKAELQVRKRTVGKVLGKSSIETNSAKSCVSQSVPSATKMFYPPCPQYYPVALNEWSNVIPVQCPLYSLQPVPVIVNPMLSTQICTYPPILAIPPGTVTNEFPVSPLVSVTNEFSLHMSNEVSPTGTPMPNDPVYCELPPVVANLSHGYSNKVAFSGVSNSLSPFATRFPDEITPAMTPMPSSNELSSLVSLGYEFSTIGTPMSDFFPPIQSMQIPNEYIPICATVSDEISPLPLYSCSYESLSYEYSECELPNVDDNSQAEFQANIENPLEFYLTLPKDLFPTARMMTLDPNSIIDEFCKVHNLDDYSWILDLEFGVPTSPVTRRVATYNVKFNSIHCKNTPEAIHPGFENCDKDLKRALIFYYDCVISNWYRGFMAINSDQSVENFQSWLLLPMQILGMCWP